MNTHNLILSASLITLSTLVFVACDLEGPALGDDAVRVEHTPPVDERLQSDQELDPVAKPDAPTPPEGVPPLLSADWRIELDAEVSRLRSHAPEWFDALMDATPLHNRAGDLSFALPAFEDPNAMVVLLHRYLEDREGDPELRAACIEALHRTRGDYAIPLTELFAQADEPVVRVAMIRALRRLNSEVALRGVALGVSDSDPLVRLAAVEAIGIRNDGGLRSDALVDALTDTDPRVQAAAAQALGFHEHGSTDVADQLEPLLRSEHPQVRLRSLQAMERIQPGRVATTADFTSLLGDEEPAVARAAASVIAD